MIFFVLGMHKSGTTLVSETLHKSSINMGSFDESVGYDSGNQYERAEMLKINDMILKSENASSINSIKPVYENKIDERIKEEIEMAVKTLNNNYDHWGMKEPRTCLTYLIWKKYLPSHKVIVVFRHPEEVFLHYLKYIPKYKVHLKIIHGYKALRAWYIYNCEILKFCSANSSNCIYIEFSEFMNSNNSLSKLSEFTGIELKDCRKQKMYRAKRSGGKYYSLIKILNIFFKRNVEELYVKMLSMKHI